MNHSERLRNSGGTSLNHSDESFTNKLTESVKEAVDSVDSDDSFSE